MTETEIQEKEDVMGIFGKMFEKKVCDICGEEIGLLGNRKLEDGNCCKNCAKKLSPWFNERKHSTISEIKAQLEYREANRAEVSAFNVTRELGERTKVYIDENAGKFMVTSSSDFEEANPDVVRCDQVTGCDLDIQESKNEVYQRVRGSDGEMHNESYSPRRYNYSYNFRMIIHVNHPYFDVMEFQLSNGYVLVETSEAVHSSFLGFDVVASNARRTEGSSMPPTLEERREDADYARYEQMGTEIKNALMNARQEQRQMQNQAAENGTSGPQPGPTVFCQYCGAPNNHGGAFCENCGAKLTD